MRYLTLTLLGLPLCLTSTALHAQATPAAPTAPGASSATDEDDPYGDEIVVRGQKPRGAVIGDIQPEIVIGPADIRSYGVNNISDLLDELAPETQSDRGRGGAPVVLLNGRRISGFGEIRDLPTEAIQRVEILPEEVSLKYGYSADQRVVNIVLRRRFHALVGQAGGGFATEGGGERVNPELNLVRIRDDKRFSVNLRYQQNARLLESDRDVRSTGSGRPYDLTGNVAAPASAASREIDPALSALAGETVTVAGVPASALNGAPSLADFAATANDPNVTDISRYRTLRGSSQQFSTNIVYAHPVFARSTATVNGSLSYARGDSLTGLPGDTLLVPADDPFSPFDGPVALYRYDGVTPLHQRTETLDGHLGLSVNGDRGHWRWSLTGNYDYGENNTRTQTGLDTSTLQARIDALDPSVNPFASPAPGLLGGILVDRARSVSNAGALQAVVGGPLFKLPAGSAGTNIKLGFEMSGFDVSSLRAGIDQSSDLTRRNANGQISIDLPIASRKEHVLPWLGSLSVNLNVAARQLSDFGTLRTYGYGLHWAPASQISLIASVTDDQGAPTMQQLGNPLILTPQVRVFDYITGRTVDVTQVAGGNRDLLADDRRVMKLGVTLKPLAKSDLTLSANYLHTRTRNAVAGLPSPTADIEAAFPDRFVRDDQGNLLRVDTRPVNFQRERQDELRMGVNFSVPLKSSRQRKFEAWVAARRAGQDVPPPFPIPQRMAERMRLQTPNAAPGDDGAAPPPQGHDTSPPADGGSADRSAERAGGDRPGGRGGGGFRGGGRGGFGGGRGGNGGGRLQFAIYDTWTLRDDVLIRPGVPLIDLLEGGSVGAGGGQPEHKVQVQLGYANNGIGVRLSGNWQSGTTVHGGPGSATGDLHFADFVTANLRLFADLSQMTAFTGKKWARGMRLTVSLNNLTDSRQHVRDANGNTPLSYQPAYLDPLGRTIMVSVRKLLF